MLKFHFFMKAKPYVLKNEDNRENILIQKRQK